PFAKSMPDYIMRWLASRFLDTDLQEELGILTKEVRARKAAQDAASSQFGDTAEPEDSDDPEDDSESRTHGNGSGHGTGPGNGAGSGRGTSSAAPPRPASSALTDEPPVIPAIRKGLDLGPACQQCGGMMQRTGSCYTCSSCGFNTGCG
ncbi:MAG: hypothetical protein J2P57_10280, partial [Acidimicrobiaceae bacterium]|nr:hypothetical protein [Acidimicrobiaceae bacterium]